MKKEKLSALISLLSCIGMLCTSVFVPSLVTASDTDITLYSQDFQDVTEFKSESNHVEFAVKNEDASSGFGDSYNSNNKYLEVRYPSDIIDRKWRRTFSLIKKADFGANIEQPLTIDDVSVTEQSFKFNLAQMTRTGGYGLVYCYWYKEDQSYQQIVIGRKSVNEMGVWIRHEYKGYADYYTDRNSTTKYVCSNLRNGESVPDSQNKEIMTGSNIDITNSANAWYTCTIKFTSATCVNIKISDGTNTYEDSFEDYNLAPNLWQNGSTGAIDKKSSGLALEDLRKTQGIGIGVVSNTRSQEIVAVDDVNVTVDADTYAADLKAAKDKADALTVIENFRSKYTDELGLSTNDFESLYTANVSDFKIKAAKINAAINEYAAFNEFAKAGLTEEINKLNSLKSISDKYAYSYGETYTQDFNDGVTAGNWSVVNESEALARAEEIGHKSSVTQAKFIETSDSTKGYVPAHVKSWITYTDMSLRLISVMNDISTESRGRYAYSSISFDTIAQAGENGSKYIYWYKDKNNYKWFMISHNTRSLRCVSGAVIDGYTVETRTLDPIAYDGVALKADEGNFDSTNGSPVNITVLYKADGAYCSASFEKNGTTYKTQQVNLDDNNYTITDTNNSTTYSSYSELDNVSGLKGIGNSTNGGFGIATSPWYGDKNYIDNLKVTYNLPYTLKMVKGAYLRTKMPTGIRFDADISVNDNFTDDNIELISGGILYMPEDKTDGKLTYEMISVANSKGAKAFDVYTDNFDKYSSPAKIQAAMFGNQMLKKYFDREFTARAYIKYRFTDDADGVYRIMYADENAEARSLSQVLIACAKAECETEYTDGKDALNALIEKGIIKEDAQ